MGCPASLDQRTLSCLQRLDSDTFASSAVIVWPFGPVVDSFSTDPFLPMGPFEAMKSGQFNKIPFMSGTVTFEGALVTGFAGLTGVQGLDTLDLIENPQGAIGEYFGNFGPKELYKVAAKFYNHTTGDSRVELETPAMNFYTDIMFLSQEQKSLELMGEHTKTLYNYYLTQQTNFSLLGQWFNVGWEHTPMHGDDIVLLTTPQEIIDGDNVSEDERATAMHVLRYWTNFAKYGSPSPGFGRDLAESWGFDSPVWFPVAGWQKVRSYKCFPI